MPLELGLERGAEDKRVQMEPEEGGPAEEDQWEGEELESRNNGTSALSIPFI